MAGMYSLNAIKIGLASPEMIREWSYGEVKKPETINYRTLKAGARRPVLRTHLWPAQRTGSATAASIKRCALRAKICDRCGVEVTKSQGAP